MPLPESLLQPISGENPAGQNLYYDNVFAQIKEARREDEDDIPEGAWELSKKKKADYRTVIKLAGDALEKANSLVTQLQPMVTRLDSLTQKMDTSLPPLMDHADKFLDDGDTVLSNFTTPDGRRRLNDMLDSLRVSTENLKVVSTNAKALTATLAEKPWRVFWGGETVKPPSEDTVLKSNQVIRLKPDVDVNGSMPTTNNVPPAKRP